MADPSISIPAITTLYGIPLQTKRRALYATQGQSATIQFQMLDTAGNPVDITAFTSQSGLPVVEGESDVVMKIREVLSTSFDSIITIDCSVDDGPTGLISCELPSLVANNAAVYEAEFGVYKPDVILSSAICPDPRMLAFTNKAYVWIDRGLFGCPEKPDGGPPNLAELRIFIRDSAPEENLLLDDFEFDLADVCEATTLCVSYWNESQPPIMLRFMTSNYPVRYWLTTGTAGYLLMMSAHRFRRNQLPYQAGGIAIDDQNKERQYFEAGTQLVADYRDWVKKKKVQINAEGAITSGYSGYQLYYWSH